MKRQIACVFALGFLLGLWGCAGVNQFIQEVDCDLSSPGVLRIKNTPETMQEHSCTFSTGFKFMVVETKVSPFRVKKGALLCHRIIYALCPESPAQSYPVRVERIVYYQGLEACRYTSELKFNPGSWDVDVKVPVPSDAAEGLYALKTVINIEKKDYEILEEFEVISKE